MLLLPFANKLLDRGPSSFYDHVYILVCMLNISINKEDRVGINARQTKFEFSERNGSLLKLQSGLLAQLQCLLYIVAQTSAVNRLLACNRAIRKKIKCARFTRPIMLIHRGDSFHSFTSRKKVCSCLTPRFLWDSHSNIRLDRKTRHFCVSSSSLRP